jgi:hypothetical protein
MVMGLVLMTAGACAGQTECTALYNWGIATTAWIRCILEPLRCATVLMITVMAKLTSPYRKDVRFTILTVTVMVLDKVGLAAVCVGRLAIILPWSTAIATITSP